MIKCDFCLYGDSPENCGYRDYSAEVHEVYCKIAERKMAAEERRAAREAAKLGK